MRKAGPILILLIGALALFVDFFPKLAVPDSQSADGSWRPIETKLGLDLEGRPAGRVPGAAGRGQVAGRRRHGDHQGHRRAPGQPDRRLRAGRRDPGQRPRRRRAAGRHRSGVRAPPRRPDRSARLRAARPDDRPGRSGPRSQGEPAVVQRRPGPVGDGRDGPERASGGRLRPQGRGRQAVRRLHDAAQRRVLRDHPRQHGDLGAGHQRSDPQRPGPDHRRRSARLCRQGRRRTWSPS